MARHGRFLARNLEYSDISGNHLTSCLLGSLVLGLALPEERESARWRSSAGSGLRREILAQVHPDGVCHEGSIPYHRLVLELFLTAEVLACRHGIDLGAAYRERLVRMLDVLVAVRRPDGLLPLWGDNDDGSVLRLSADPVQDPGGLLAAAGVLLGRPDLAAAGRPRLEELLLAGLSPARRRRRCPRPRSAASASQTAASTS